MKKVKVLVTQLCPTVTPWTVAHLAFLSMGFSRQEYWSGLPCSLPGDPLNSETEPRFPTLQADYLPTKPPGKPKGSRQGSHEVTVRILVFTLRKRGSNKELGVEDRAV